MKIINKIQKDLESYYEQNKIKENDSQKVGWKNNHAQEIRFRQFLNALSDDEGFSVNDFGCGFGDLFGYLSQMLISTVFEYKGYDILEEMINKANTKYKGVSNASFFLIKNASEMAMAGTFKNVASRATATVPE